jgi:Domain of unknown function (DUF4386)
MQESDFANRVSGLTLRQAALIAGITYLLNPVTFAEAYAMPRLVVADANQTVANIAAHPHLFSAAVLSYFFSLLGDVVFAWTFYVLLAPVNRALSLLASWLQLTYAAVSLAEVSNLGLLYRLLVIPGYSGHVSASSLPAQGILLLGSFRSGWGLGLILFGLHLVLPGWLIARSSYLPRWLGWLLFADGWAWVVDNLSVYLFPNASLGFLKVFFLAELIFMVWLLGWGWRIPEPR